jgi:hypothetical protein
MSRKHYRAIATVIRDSRMDALDKRLVAEALAAEFKQENPRFCRERFLTACGVSQ